MAYGNNQNRNNQNQNQQNNATQKPAYGQGQRTQAAASGIQKKTDKVKVAGIYPYEKKDGTPSKLLFRGKTMSEVVIPAGYTVSIFEAGGKSKNGKDLPPLEIVASPAFVRSNA